MKSILLVFDTETTGLLPRTNSENIEDNPYIIQLSWIIYDIQTNKVIEMYDKFLNIPNHVEITKKSIQIHGITRVELEKYGENASNVLFSFIRALNSCDYVIGHNISFDWKMITIECIRNNLYPNLLAIDNNIKQLCTMKDSIDICNLPFTNKKYTTRKKWPKLIELHQTLFNTSIKSYMLHNALIDVIVCLRCACKLYFHKDIYDENHLIQKMYNDVIGI